MRLSWSDPLLRNIVWQVIDRRHRGGASCAVPGRQHQRATLPARHIATGFGFLGRTAGIPIGEALIPYNPSVNTYFGLALLEGLFSIR